MKRLLKIPYIVVLLVLLPVGVFADEIVSLKVGYISLVPEGSFASRETGFADTEIDIEDDVDLGDSEEVMAEAAVQLGPFRLGLGYLPLKFSGTSNPTQPITFGGRTFNVTETVDGDMDVDLYDLGLTWYLINFDDLPTRIQLGPEVSVKIVDGELSIASQTTGIREEVSGTAAVPTIGLRGRIGFGDFVGVTGRVGYVEYSDNSFLDADAQVEFSPLPFLGVFGGYRYLDLDVDEADIFIDARFSGPYAGAFVRF